MNSHDFYTRPENYDYEFERQMINRLQPRVPDKVMYASDGFNYAFGNASRCFAIGGNFLALGEGMATLNLPPDYQYKPINAFAENMLATFAEGDVCELSEAQWQDFFYNNAAKLHYPLIRK